MNLIAGILIGLGAGIAIAGHAMGLLTMLSGFAVLIAAAGEPARRNQTRG